MYTAKRNHGNQQSSYGAPATTYQATAYQPQHQKTMLYPGCTCNGNLHCRGTCER